MYRFEVQRYHKSLERFYSQGKFIKFFVLEIYVTRYYDNYLFAKVFFLHGENFPASVQGSCFSGELATDVIFNAGYVRLSKVCDI